MNDEVRAGALTRFLVLRLLGLVYLMAFLTWVFQGPALVGAHGLLPTGPVFDEVALNAGSRLAAFWQAPSLFWLVGHSDAVLFGAGWVGVALAAAVMLGYANVPILVVLWALQVSIADAGQVFYGFGWELQLAETGFLCAFLVPVVDGRPFPRLTPSPIVIWLLRWLIVRVMWGAGLIKLRGDPCWRNLTCLDTYFETQPVPNPLTPFFHAWPSWMHRGGVLFNHVIELAAPVLLFCPRRARLVGAVGMAALQVSLILSGNLSFLNWLTLIPILACFDDGVWRRLLPARLTAFADRAHTHDGESRPRRVVAIALAVLVGGLSVPVMLNLVSAKQAMNTSFTRLPLVNTYGAFGSVNTERNELIFEGTTDENVTPDSRWLAYEWKCKPGDPARAPCWMSPYHRRLDWLAWFAAMGDVDRHPWAVHLVWKLLGGDRPTLSLLAGDPFAGAGHPPRHVRVELYRYKLNGPFAKGWWTRERIGEWLPPLSRDNENLRRYIQSRGWD